MTSVLNVYAAEKIVSDDVEGRGFRVGSMCSVIADAADETAYLHFDVDVGGTNCSNSPKVVSKKVCSIHRWDLMA